MGNLALFLCLCVCLLIDDLGLRTESSSLMANNQPGGGLDGFGIQEADLMTGGGGKGAAGQDQGQSTRRQRKRKLGDMALEAAGNGKEGAAADGGGGSKPRRRGRRGAPNEEDAREGEPSASTEQQQQQQEQRRQQQRQPWLAEHLSVRLFDSGWESRHGAALGLTALFKAWRQRKREGVGPKAAAVVAAVSAADGWNQRWSEDVAGRCLCLLALDRFGDFSMGGAVAPIREVAGQLLGLVLAPDAATAAGGGGGVGARGGSPVLLPRALGHLQALAAAGAGAAGTAEEADDEGGELRPWEVRHGAFVGLKYLVVLPSEVRSWPVLMRLDPWTK
jgi:hypothetical protein